MGALWIYKKYVRSSLDTVRENKLKMILRYLKGPVDLKYTELMQMVNDDIELPY